MSASSKQKQPTSLPEKQVIKRLQSKTKAVPQRLKTGVSSLASYSRVRKGMLLNSVKARRSEPGYKSFRLQKRIKPDLKDLPTSWQLIRQSLKFIAIHKRIMLGIFFIHLVVYFFVVRSPIQPDVTSIQNAISSAVEGSGTQINGLQNSVVTIGAVVESASFTQQNGLVTALVVLGFSLAYVWALRQLHNNHKIKIRDALYQGMAPIIPVMFIVGALVLELLPFAFASFIYSLARTSGIFVTGFEDLAFFTLTMLTGLLSFYWMTSGVIALYMAALPGVYPFYALHSARKLVQFQRLRVFRRIIVLPILFATIYLIVLLLSIRFIPSITFITAEVVQLLFIPFAHTYLYKLYRSML